MLYKTLYINYIKIYLIYYVLNTTLWCHMGTRVITFPLCPLFAGLICGTMHPLPSGTTETGDEGGFRNVLNLKHSQFRPYCSGSIPPIGEKGRTHCQVSLCARGYDA